MKRVYCLMLSLLLITQSTQRTQASTAFEYATLGVQVASLVGFVWSIAAIKNMIEDLASVIYLGNVSQQQDRDLDRQLKSWQVYLVYLKSVEARIKAAYLLKYTPDSLLQGANFNKEERLLAASLQALNLDETVEEDFSWYGDSENVNSENVTVVVDRDADTVPA